MMLAQFHFKPGALRESLRVSLCAVHVRQFEGASPLSNLVEVKD
jgi:hypothetical protein